MNIYNSSVAYYLAGRFHTDKAFAFSRDRLINGIDILEQNSSAGSLLYLVTDYSIRPSKALLDSSAFLLYGAETIPEIYKHSSFCVVTEKETGFRITKVRFLQLLWEIYHSIEGWMTDLLSLQLNKAPVSSFFDVLPRMIKTPALLLDKNFHPLAATENCRTIVNKFPELLFIYDEETADNKNEVARTLYPRRDYQENLHRKGFYPAVYEDHRSPSTCYNFWQGAKYIGLIVFFEMNYAKIPEGELHILSAFVKALEKVITEGIKKNIQAEADQRLHELFLKITGEKDQNEESYVNVEFAGLLKHWGWKENDSLRIINLSFFKGISGENSGQYVCEKLEDLYVDSLAVNSDDRIFWLINCTLMGYEGNDPKLYSMLQDVVETYICKAGVCCPFQLQDRTGIARRAREAAAALMTGDRTDPHRWYYFFQDYLKEYLMYQMTRELSEAQLYPPQIKKLLDYDKTNHTDYLKLLAAYYKNGKNASKTAKQLYFQRTTLNRKLEKIEAIAGMPLDDENDFCVRISLEFLRESF